MKIAAIKTYVLSADLKTPFAYSQGWYDKRMALVVEVVSDEGLSGFGEVYGPPRPNRGVVEAYAPLLIGEDPFAIERHWQRLYNHLRDHGQRGLAIQALSGIDIALWDLKGRALGQPVHVLMGGPIRDRVRAYATGLYRRDRPDHETYLREEAASYAAAGLSAMKLKIGWGIAEDIRLTRALRDEIGPEVGLMVDANHAYDSVDALRYARAVENVDIGWFRSRSRPRITAAIARSRPARPFPLPAASARSPASASATSSLSVSSTSPNPTPARPEAFPSARRSPTWPRPSASATCPIAGAPASPAPRRCSFSPCCRTTRPASAPPSRSSSST
jgi:D-galactarolactone cycloisomerase